MFENFITWFFHKWALRALRAKERKDLATFVVLKDWVTACIIERKQEGRRKELVELQQKIKETELFYKWLSEQK